MLQDQTTFEEIIPGLQLEWLYENRIVMLTLSSAERNVIDAYVDLNIAVIRAWPEDRLYLTIQAVRSGFTMTPYLSRSALEIFKVCRELGISGRNAVIVPHPRLAQIMQLLIQTRRGLTPDLKARMFSDRDQALNWLIEAL